MDQRRTLHSCLIATASQTPALASVVAVIAGLADAAPEIAELVATAPIRGITGEAVGTNTDGDSQKEIDIAADRIIRQTLVSLPVAAVVSEELEAPELLSSSADLCIAIDPLDGSANLENNVSVGTIFSIRKKGKDALSSFFEPGTMQVAAGFFVYGPQTTLVLALDGKVDIYTLDWHANEFVLTTASVRVPADTPEFAINASNRRHWMGPVRAYIDDCLAGQGGESGKDYNMRWIGSLVAESLRILMRGGVFLYPSDARPGYREGRLRLLYEAHPMALVMEWAGGAATTGRHRILDLSTRALHQRVPLIMGSARGVRAVDAVHESVEPMFESDAPLFARRGLFR